MQENKTGANIFWVSKEARWSYIKENAKKPTIGQIIDDAMVAIEKDNAQLKGVLPKDYARPSLDYCILSLPEVFNEIVSKGDGSAQPNISPSSIESIKIILPPEYLISKFNDSVKPVFYKILKNLEENLILGELRDSLLPRLMSGEIRVTIEEVAVND